MSRGNVRRDGARVDIYIREERVFAQRKLGKSLPFLLDFRGEFLSLAGNRIEGVLCFRKWNRLMFHDASSSLEV